ncbi:MAG: hypothetical protein ABI658_21370 [Acidimicrobiales bacterium]
MARAPVLQESTTTTSRPASAAGEFVSGRPGSVLGSQTGWTVYLSAGDTLFAADLDTGRIRSLQLDASAPREPAGLWLMLTVPGALFASGYRNALVANRDLSQRTLVRDRSFYGTFPAATGTIWVPHTEGPTSPDLIVDELDRSGNIARSFRLHLDNSGIDASSDFHLAGIVGSEFVFEAQGRIILIDIDSQHARTWAIGAVVAVGGGRVVWRECTAATTCQTYGGTSANPKAVKLGNVFANCGPLNEGIVVSLCPIAITANGRYVLGEDLDVDWTLRSPEYIDLWDLDTGTHTAIKWPTAKLEPIVGNGYASGVKGVWPSPDGCWLFALQETGRVTAYQVATGQVVEFDVIEPLSNPENKIAPAFLHAFAVGS